MILRELKKHAFKLFLTVLIAGMVALAGFLWSLAGVPGRIEALEQSSFERTEFYQGLIEEQQEVNRDQLETNNTTNRELEGIASDLTEIKKDIKSILQNI